MPKGFCHPLRPLCTAYPWNIWAVFQSSVFLGDFLVICRNISFPDLKESHRENEQKRIFTFSFFSLFLSHFPVFKRGGHVEVFCIYLSHLLDLWQNSHKRIGFQIHWLDNFHLQMCPVLRIMKMTVSVSFCSKFIAQIKLWKCWF